MRYYVHLATETAKWLLMILGFFFTIAILWFFILKPPTYATTEDLYAGLEDKVVEKGDVVTAKVISVKENPVLGYEVWLSDEIALVGSDGEDVKPGDEIKFEVIGGQENLGVWMITYKLVN